VVPDFRGGMLCDEPGLGKTVTALALILARRGLLPASPASGMDDEDEDMDNSRPSFGSPLQPSKRRCVHLPSSHPLLPPSLTLFCP
jgi:SNF2 family DNA or RNA helicase